MKFLTYNRIVFPLILALYIAVALNLSGVLQALFVMYAGGNIVAMVVDMITDSILIQFQDALVKRISVRQRLEKIYRESKND